MTGNIFEEAAKAEKAARAICGDPATRSSSVWPLEVNQHIESVAMNVREIVIAHLKSIGADGLCGNSECGCGCGLDDLMPCDYGERNCKPAKAHPCDGTCQNCDDQNENIVCYRPMDTNEPEETRL